MRSRIGVKLSMRLLCVVLQWFPKFLKPSLPCVWMAKRTQQAQRLFFDSPTEIDQRESRTPCHRQRWWRARSNHSQQMQPPQKRVHCRFLPSTNRFLLSVCLRLQRWCVPNPCHRHHLPKRFAVRANILSVICPWNGNSHTVDW